MKILAIRGANIASLERFDVDFRQEPLASAGIFAITGPTGSGKSSLLDAMCLALFHKAPRLEGISGQEAKVGSSFGEIGQDDIRNLIRRGAATGFAETEFQATDGESYRARWGYRAGKRRDAAAQEEVSLLRLSDGQVLDSKKTEVRDRVVKLSGLTFEQFSRTVLLAQGRFAEFLRSKENERAELLEKLTGTVIYSRISRAIYERKTAEEKSRDELASKVQGIRILSGEELGSLERKAKELAKALPEAEDRENRARDFRDAVGERSKCLLERGRLVAEVEGSKHRVELADAAMHRARTEESAFQDWIRERERQIQDAMVLDSRIGSQEALFDDLSRRWTDSGNALAKLEDERKRLGERLSKRKTELAVVAGYLESKSRLGPIAEDWQQCRTLLDLCAQANEEVRTGKERLKTIAGRIEKAAPGIEELERQVEVVASRAGEGSFEDLTRQRGVEATKLEETKRAREICELRVRAAECDKKCRELSMDLESAGTVESEIGSGLKVARRMLEAARLASSADVEALRRNLVDGEPCPVCGALQHPQGAADGHGMDALLQEQRRIVESLEKNWVDARSAISRIEAGLERSAIERDRIAQAMERSGAIEEWISLALEGTDDLSIPDRIDGWIEERQARMRDLDRRLSDFASLSSMRQKLSEALRVLDADREEGRRCEETVSRCEADFAKHAEVLDRKFGSAAWRTKWEIGPSAYLDGLERQVAEYRTKLAEKERMEVEQGKDEERLRGIEPQISEKADELSVNEKDRSEAEGLLADLRRGRNGLLGGATVQQAKVEADRRGEEVRDGLVAAKDELDSINRERHRLDGLLEGLTARMNELEAGLLRMGPAVAKSAGGDWMACRTEDGFRDEALAALATTSFEQASTGARTMRDERVKIATELEIDRGNRESVADLQSELRKRSEVAIKWANLSAAIGSADGKAFKIIAQQFTLEALLLEANRELSIITSRYSLRMLGESMHFGVVDHESFDELRPVHTLSGGETFIVSLALALGLSRMAGGELSVESLFIDEGFGTLDSDALRCVMTALSQLHAQGRKVGLITHVEEMKEQIPVRIEVSRLGQGASRVEVVG